MTFEEIKEHLSTAKVGICGAGGLGSNCATSLARVGVGKLLIADYDIVTESNLKRQYFFHDQIGIKKVVALKENLLRINPDISVVCIDEKLQAESIALNFWDCDVIVEAFDKSETKQMIIEAVHTYFPNIPLVCGIGIASYGNLNDIRLHEYGNLYVCGDLKSEASDDNPAIAPRVGVVSNMQADVVISLLLNNKK
jgi:sulfur carrier protein ThiS adenylyltransferase